MKNLKQFISENDIVFFEGTNEMILSVFANETSYGMDVDTSKIIAGTELTKYFNFFIDDDIIKIDHIELNLNTTYIFE